MAASPWYGNSLYILHLYTVCCIRDNMALNAFFEDHNIQIRRFVLSWLLRKLRGSLLPETRLNSYNISLDSSGN